MPRLPRSLQSLSVAHLSFDWTGKHDKIIGQTLTRGIRSVGFGPQPETRGLPTLPQERWMSQGSSEASAQGSDPSSAMTAHGMNAPSTNASALRASDPGLTVDLNPDDVAKAIHRSLHDSNLPVKPPLVPEGYEILGKLGEGTYGEVWKGQHARTGFQVAVKFLPARTSSQLLLLGQDASKLT